MTVATIQNLRVSYGKRVIIPDLSVEIPSGCVGLLGPNGAGKTTLLKTILGFVKSERGGGELLGLRIGRDVLRIRQAIGLMPEVDCHIPGMNAVSFVAYTGELSGLPPTQALRRAHECLEYCGLGEARYRNIETYSTGMKQRIKLAQAIVHGPRLVFLDEPTNGLDPDGRDDMLNLVRDISHNKGVNVVVSSHLLPDIERTCDRVIVMKSGEVVRQGLVSDLREAHAGQWLVELKEPSPAYERSLTDLGVKVLSSRGAQLVVDLGKDQEQGQPPGQLFLSVGRQSAVQVRGYRPAHRSLEEIFVEAVG